MKKSTLLSLLTAGAVIATSAGTFAAWDQTKGTATSEVLNFRPGVTTTVTAANFTETNAVIGEDPKFTSTPTIEVKNIPDSVDPTAYNIKVSAYAFDTVAHANDAAKVSDPSTSTGYLSSVTTTVTDSEKKLSEATNGKITPTITATTTNDTENTAGTATTAYILVVAELTPDNSAA